MTLKKIFEFILLSFVNLQYSVNAMDKIWFFILKIVFLKNLKNSSNFYFIL